MNFWASLEYAVGVMIGTCSVIGVVGAKYRNHYAQIVMVGISGLMCPVNKGTYLSSLETVVACDGVSGLDTRQL